MVAPLLMLVSSALFIGALQFSSFAELLSGLFACSVLYSIVIAGTIQNVCSKVLKFTFIDNSKEIAFQVMSDEERPRAKALGDAFSSRLGKASSVWTEQGLLLAQGSAMAAAPFLAVTVLLSGGAWVWATGTIAPEVEERMQVNSSLGHVR